ncbi:hypothetical protein ABT339_14555 [Micromonospora sp. NPDC000119]|uniref:hypothetical protein n=1 Tax=Micromonospora sp. NPDC000119 TaxID=3154242 RepID=UPI00332449A0
MNDGSTGMQYTPRPPARPWLRAAIPERAMRRADLAGVMCTNSAIAGDGSWPAASDGHDFRALHALGATDDALIAR